MHGLRFLCGFCAWIAGLSLLPAQSAQQIIDSAAKVYAEAPAYSVQMDSRTLQLAIARSEKGQAPRFDLRGARYQRLEIKLHRSGDWWVSSQSASEGVGLPETPMGLPQSGSPLSSFRVLSRVSAASKQGHFLGGRFVIRDVPPAQFAALLNSQTGGGRDLVLRHFQTAVPSGNIPLGVIDPELIGAETQGRGVYRIAATTTDGEAILLWIQKDTFLVLRSVVKRQRGRAGYPPDGSGPASPFVTLQETLYYNQNVMPAFSLQDFNIVPPAGNERLVGERMGFGDVAQLVTLMTSPEDGDLAATLPAVTPEAAPVVPPAAPVPATGQLLSYEQMSGIVLIEAEGSTASGFMTRIRDTDFVVTNQHVLGDGRKFTVKNLRGEIVPVSGIFGAIGSDIAILRIAKVEGELVLASDVLQTAKIGDKVVVVGNRLGGGVATQTSGLIVGIGPTRIEVNANFEPGNSGSPIVDLVTNEVIGVATYSETRRINVEEGGASRANASAASGPVEKRWFGYRLDSVTKWEAIDLAKWRSQSERLGRFRELSEALLAFVKYDLREARLHPRLGPLIDDFETRYRRTSGNSVSAANEVKDLIRIVRTVSEDGIRELSNGEYYDYYRNCLYWENNIPAQIEFRNALVGVLRKYEANSSAYLSRMRNGN